MRVLVVEDSDSDAFYVQMLLRDLGGELEVDRRATLAEALSFLEHDPECVVLLDLGLPDGEGLEVLHAVRSVAPRAVVVVLSGMADRRLALQAVQEGAQDYLYKPGVDLDRLDRALRYAVERQRAELLLEDRELFHRAVLDSVPGPVLVVGASGEIRMVNRAWQELLGKSGSGLGRSLTVELAEQVYGPAAPEVVAAVEAVARGALDHYRMEVDVPNGEVPRRLAVEVTPLQGLDGGAVVGHRDLGHRRVTAADHNSRDPLTGLPNRAALLTALRTALDAAPGKVGLVRVELMRYPLIVEDLGLEVGDLIATQAAERLESVAPAGSTVALLGPGSLAVVVSGVSGTSQLEDLTRLLVRPLADPFLVGGVEVLLDPRAGAAVAAHRTGPERLLREAGAAMLAAREGHGTDVQVFDPSLASRFWGMGQIESELRDSLHRRQLVLHYQPEVNVGDGEVVGLEALIRWQHPQRGTLSPVEFLPVAEDSGLIVDIGEWVLGQALNDAAGWQRSVKERHPNIYVNLSVRQLGHPALVDSVRRLLDQTGARPGSLGLEITETMLLRDPEAVVPILQDLRLLGVRVGIDDFGTGYASLDVLRRLPVDFVKIDRSFVERLTYSAQDSAIVRAIVGMADGLGIEVVAEGVETLRQLTALREAGCRVVQGYYFSPPQPAYATARLLEDGRRS